MPELPDVTVYVEALEKRFVGRSIRQLQIRSPFVLRTFEIQPDEISGCRVNASENESSGCWNANFSLCST
jgi:formamidopyrimidine-DNA glycosylase